MPVFLVNVEEEVQARKGDHATSSKTAARILPLTPPKMLDRYRSTNRKPS
jgi:hypothetical protein